MHHYKTEQVKVGEIGLGISVAERYRLHLSFHCEYVCEREI